MSSSGTSRPDTGAGRGGDPPAGLVEIYAGPSGALLRAMVLAGVAMPLLAAGHREEDPDR